MAEFILTRKAVGDLTDIWNYTVDEWSEEQADSYYRQLIVQCQNIADQPTLGKEYPEVYSDLRGVISGRHIIFYRKIDSQTIEIIRILHQRMDLKGRF